MMSALWQAVQALTTLSFTSDAGRSGDCADAGRAAASTMLARARAGRSLRDMDFHLIIGVVKISAWIPNSGCRLRVALTIGCSGQNCVVAGLWRLPGEAPHPPSVLSLFVPKLGGFPS